MDIGNVEKIESAVSVLSKQDLARFRHWFAEFDADAWDAQIEEDAASGRLESLAQEAIAEYQSGKSADICAT